jgi:DNA processing protein
LWAEVAEAGVVLSEWPPGTPPDAFRFPQRNRILAALCELLVVVESRERGGSLITAREAAERGIDVYAVPGPVDQRSSAGTNALLEDGAAPVASTDTLLVALGLDTRRSGRRSFDSRVVPRGDELVALGSCRERPHSVESLALVSGWDLARAALALARLERSGWLSEAGGWFEEVDEFAHVL